MATLLLESRDAQERREWRRSAAAEAEAQVDALPYLDKEYEDPAVRAEVNRLVQEEMRRSPRTPADILSELPPVPELRSELLPMFARECERVRAGRPPTLAVDTGRYEGAGKGPAGRGAEDPNAWKGAVKAAMVQLQHQDTRHENLDLMLRFGPNAWKVHNQHLEAFLAKAQREVAERKREIELLNRDRRLNQQAAAVELGRLEQAWREGVQKNADIQAACAQLEAQIEGLKAEAQALGVVTDNSMQED
ncbi:unnamed protein product [Closterium sp. NIES-53]